MTITFGNDIDIIVYAFQKDISHARDNQSIFVTQSIWWISLIIGLQQGLVVYIVPLRERASKAMVDTSWEGTKNIHPSRLCNIPASLQEREVSAILRVIQQDTQSNGESSQVQPDEISQVRNTSGDISTLDVGNSKSDWATQIIDITEKFIIDSRRDRKALKKKPDPLLCTRSGKFSVKPLSKKQRNYLQSIPKDMIAEYLSARKYDLPP